MSAVGLKIVTFRGVVLNFGLLSIGSRRGIQVEMFGARDCW